MKKHFLNFALITLVAAGVVSCKDGAKEAETTEAQEVAEAAPVAEDDGCYFYSHVLTLQLIFHW